MIKLKIELLTIDLQLMRFLNCRLLFKLNVDSQTIQGHNHQMNFQTLRHINWMNRKDFVGIVAALVPFCYY